MSTRNRLVHEYLNVELAQLAEAARRAPSDYGDYVRQVAQFVLAQGKGGT